MINTFLVFIKEIHFAKYSQIPFLGPFLPSLFFFFTVPRKLLVLMTFI